MKNRKRKLRILLLKRDLNWVRMMRVKNKVKKNKKRKNKKKKKRNNQRLMSI